jgi:hypothetical protein
MSENFEYVHPVERLCYKLHIVAIMELVLINSCTVAILPNANQCSVKIEFHKAHILPVYQCQIAANWDTVGNYCPTPYLCEAYCEV